MTYTISETTRMASAAAVILLAILLLIRHLLLPRLQDAQLRRFEAPLLLLFGVFAVFLIANFLEALP